MGWLGLIATVRYITSDHVSTGMGFEGTAQERDLDIGYTVQSGPLRMWVSACATWRRARITAAISTRTV